MEQLQLVRNEVAQVSSTAPNTLKVLPSAANKKQKIVVGDNAGVVSCWRYGNKIESEQVFATTPTEREVTALTLGGARAHKDKIYAAFGQTIVGLKKKGKEFFRFNTSLNEDIHSLCIDNNRIYSAGEYIFNMFDNCKDTDFYMSTDRINALAIELMGGASTIYSVLACQDRFIRVVDGSNLVHEMAVDAPLTALSTYPTAGSYDIASGQSSPTSNAASSQQQTIVQRRLVYGTQRGDLGEVLMTPDTIRKGWTIPSESDAASISCITHCDISKDGVDDIIVGRDDGRLQVYSYELGEVPTLQFEHGLHESVRSVATGHINNTSENDIVVCTYSGSVINFGHAENSGSPGLVPLSAGLASLMPNASTNKPSQYGIGVKEIRKEIEVLEAKLKAKRDEYQLLSNELIAVDNQFRIKQSLRLLPDEASYLLSIEIDMPIDLVALKCDVPLLLLEQPGSAAVCSISPVAKHNKNHLLATFKCHKVSNRVDIKFRTVEGQRGEITLFVVSKQYPKTSQSVSISLKPLSLHEKVPCLPSLSSDAPRLIKLRLSGSFSLSQMHSWIAECMPDVPPHLAQEEVKLSFRSSFLGTLLVCDYHRGQALLMSDSSTTISIVKDVISREATANKVVLSINLELEPSTVRSVLDRVRPKVLYYSSLNTKHSKIAALKAIEAQEGSENTRKQLLSDDYVEILEKSEEIEQELKYAPRHLEFLRGVVRNLFIDDLKLRGRSAQDKLTQLDNLLENIDEFDAIVEFFKVSV